MGTNTNYDVQTQTTTALPDPATQAFRNSIFPTITSLAQATPTVYGATWGENKPKMGADGNQVLDQKGRPVFVDAQGNDTTVTGNWAQNANQHLTAETNDATLAGQQALRGLSGGNAAPYGAAASAYQNAGNTDIYGAGAPSYGQASDYYKQAAAGQSGLAGQGQFDQATGLYNQAAGTNTANVFSPYAAQAQGLYGQAVGQYGQAVGQYGQAAGQYGQAANMYGQSTNALGLSSASPYLQAAGQTSAQQVGQYMNPYNQAVTDQIAKLGARNLSENILPQISSDFIKAGGYGSTRQRDLVGRAARDTQESILNQQAQALQSGYGQALGASSADLARQAQLAGTAGGLGTQQQQILQGAAGGYGNVASGYGNVASGLGNVASGLGNLGSANAALGSTAAGLVGSDANRQLQAGQGIQSIGQANIQASQNDLARALAAGQGMAGVGAGLGNLAQANQSGQLAVGAGQVGLAESQGAADLRRAGGLTAAGESIQGQAQRVIDADRGLVSAEQQAPFYNVGQATSIAGGAPASGTNTTQTTSTPSASLSSTLLGAGATIAGGVLAARKAKGGAIKKGSLKKASYGNLPSRGLGMFARAS